jgi:hypothetical protein
MPIPVTCSECHAAFHVGEEFAGVTGRCPECAAIIHVPDPAGPEPGPHPEPASSAPAEEHLDLSAYSTPRRHVGFDELPAPRRRPREHAERNDYDDRWPPDLPPRRTFDPVVRASRWESVSRGLRNLMVAVVLVTVNLLVITAFSVTDQIKPAPLNNFVGRNVALAFGTTVVAAIGTLLWMVGRFGCARVPFVPARQAAVPAAVVAGLTGICGLLALGMSALGILMVQQGNLDGAALVGLGICGLVPVSVGFWVAELLGLTSQVRMADGLGDALFGRMSRALFVVALVLTGLSACGGCGFFVLIMAAADQAQQQQMKKQQQAKQPPPPPALADHKLPAAKDKDKDKEKEKTAPRVKKVELPTGPRAEKGPPPRVVEAPKDAKADVPVANNGPPAPANPPANGAAPANPPAAQPPPPEIEPAEQKAIVLGLTIFTLVMALAYAGFCVACFQSGRRAIRREVHQLTGDPHDGHH